MYLSNEIHTYMLCIYTVRFIPVYIYIIIEWEIRDNPELITVENGQEIVFPHALYNAVNRELWWTLFNDASSESRNQIFFIRSDSALCIKIP